MLTTELADRITVHASTPFGAIYIAHKPTDLLLLEVTVENMSDAMLLCYLHGDEEGLAVLAADEYLTVLKALIGPYYLPTDTQGTH
ncbi:hypothetical protein D3C81_961440 [compost metagenome]